MLHRPVLEGLSLLVEVVLIGADEEGQPGVTLSKVAIYPQPPVPPQLLRLPVLMAYLQAPVLAPLRSRFRQLPSPRRNPSIRPRVQPRKTIDLA